ncbi:MAG: flagellar biosynthetic protein FliO [Firmicutes bacterium]|jgi:flagellar biosynthetic protein FliO|nr:flagellar biosynthetic protein FliO [Bacillota bacterium]
MEHWALLKAALFLGVLYVAARLLLRRQDMIRPRHMKLIDSLPLGQEGSVHLVEVEGRRLLLGVSRGGVSLLAEWSQEMKDGVVATQEVQEDARRQG